MLAYEKDPYHETAHDGHEDIEMTWGGSVTARQGEKQARPWQF